MQKIILCLAIQQLLHQVSRVESLIGNNLVQVGFGEFPFIASFQRFPEGDNFCGGALITNKHVLTLVRCLKNKNLQSYRIVFEGAHQDPAVAYTAASWSSYGAWADIHHIANIVRDTDSMAIATLTDRAYHVNPVALSGLCKMQLIGTKARMVAFNNGVLSKATVKILGDSHSKRRLSQLSYDIDKINTRTQYISAANPFALLSFGDTGSPLLHPRHNSLLGLASGISPGYDYKHGNLTTEYIRQHQVNTHSSVYGQQLFIDSIIQSNSTRNTAPVA